MAEPSSPQPPATSQATATDVGSAPTASDPPVSVVSEQTVKATEPVPSQESKVTASAPDPDEDDLDDLDDVLDDFAATKIDATSAPSASGPGRPATTDASANAADPTAVAAAAAQVTGDDSFAEELQKGMADLLGELESSPEMQKQFEDMIRELSKGSAGGLGGDVGVPSIPSGPASASVSASASEAPKGEASFQDTIRKTMDRMKESGDAAGAAAATSASSEDDFMAALLKEMENGGSEEDFSKMLLGMMEQLTNKEILYEPMKELDAKFPDWMTKNADKTPAADLKRYKEQQRLVREIMVKFEEPGYSDENVKSREYILERMQKMQGEGSPPQELVGDMDVATEALGDLDAGCPTQ